MLHIKQLNQASAAEFAALLDGIYEHSPWIAARAAALRPFTNLTALQQGMVKVVREANSNEQLTLIRAHPELAGKAAVAGTLTAESTHEQSKAGLTQCSAEEFATLQKLNADYNAKFGFPFILAVKGARGMGLTRTQIIQTFQRRLKSNQTNEKAECLRQIHRIAQMRLNEKFAHVPVHGNQVWDWAETLAQHSDVENNLTVTYMTDAHRACAKQLAAWMQECGFDEVEIDVLGNVVGRYLSDDKNAKNLITGSHYDTVRNGGKYDGRLGILAPMAAVQQLHQAGTRLPFNLEVIGFGEEEGQRFKCTFLTAQAVIGKFDFAALSQLDKDGISLEAAILAHAPENTKLSAHVPKLARAVENTLGFIEIHIEQGPVLLEMDEPLGIVSSINGSVRFVGEVLGVASHAGTTPMAIRHDAACAVAELILFAEARARQETDLVCTVGMLNVPNGSINVVPGACQFSLDIRAPNDAQRDNAVADVLNQLKQICEKRGVEFTLEETMRAAAAPSAPAWQARWLKAAQGLGLQPPSLPSGAGHDAMKMHELCPQAMLFVRCGNGGISHNPLEIMTNDDAQLCVDAFLNNLTILKNEFLLCP
jgi:N-carbamoyl-L-amino-acid hydrolase